MPYILFDIDVMKYFDKDHEFLKYWVIEDYRDSDWINGTFYLRVSEEASVKYIMEDQYIKDLKKYIKNVLPDLNDEKQNND